jgi:tetratricopeptide (TPR) repeat protein
MGGRAVGRFARGGACPFDADRPILDGEWEGNVLVGVLALCQTGPSCDERTYPILAFYDPRARTLSADIRLEAGCSSPALKDSRLLLQGVGPLGPRPAPRAEKPTREQCVAAFQRGQRLLSSADWAGAGFYFEKSLSCEEQLWGAHLGLGVSELKRGRTEKAIESMTRAQKMARARAEEEPSLYYNLATAYARNGDNRTALDHLRRAVELGWDDPAAMNEDPDLHPLRAEPAFKELIDQSWSLKDKLHKERTTRSLTP